MNELKAIRDKIDRIKFPDKVLNYNGTIQKGVAFFPCGNGITNKSTTISDKQFMILGHNQDNEKGYNKTAKKEDETYSPTWRYMRALLEQTEIREEDCFFTNFLLGITQGSTSNMGTPSSLRNTAFVTNCAKILLDQISIQQPKAIICLGLMPFKLLGLISKNILLKNVAIRAFKEIDPWNLAISRNQSFEGINNFTTTVAVIYHPCHRNLNVDNRKYKNLTGNLAEIAILNELNQKKGQ